MNPAYSFDVDVKQSMVRITMSGFFSPVDVEQFATDRNEAHRLLRSAPNQHVTLIDMRAMDIQSQESVVAFQRVLGDPATISRKIAFVVTRSLARMQIKRAAADRRAGYFEDDTAAAERWLLEDDS